MTPSEKQLEEPHLQEGHEEMLDSLGFKKEDLQIAAVPMFAMISLVAAGYLIGEINATTPQQVVAGVTALTAAAIATVLIGKTLLKKSSSE